MSVVADIGARIAVAEAPLAGTRRIGREEAAPVVDDMAAVRRQGLEADEALVRAQLRIPEDRQDRAPVQPVALAHLGVAETIGSPCEFAGNARAQRAILVELVAPRGQEIVEDERAHQARQEVVDEDGLVAPADEIPRLREEGRTALGTVHQAGIVLGQHRSQPVVKADEGLLDLVDDGILVVALVADDRALVRRTRQVVVADDQRHARDGALRGVGGRVVHVRLIGRAVSVDAVQIEARRPLVGGSLRRIPDVVRIQGGRRVQRQVMVDELPEIRISGGHEQILFRVASVGDAVGIHAHRSRHGRQLVDIVGKLVGRQDLGERNGGEGADFAVAGGDLHRKVPPEGFQSARRRSTSHRHP